MANDSPRILIIRLSAIGDVVRVLPALHVLRECFPRGQIDWAVEAKSAGILMRHPALNEVLVFTRPPGVAAALREFWGFCRRVRSRRYDIVIDFHGILKSGLIAGYSGAKTRYGFARPRARECSTLFTTHHVRLRSERLNRVEENLALCDPLCPEHGWPNVTIDVPAETRRSVDQFFEDTFDGGKLVVAMHVPMERDEKRWPVEHFAALADMLLADGRFEVLLTWAPGQFDCVEEVVRRTRRHPVVAPETSDLKQYAWLTHRADLYFGGDTGPMHIAWVMGTPVVAVFGGTDPAKHAPYHVRHVILHCGDEASGEGRSVGVQERLRRVTPDMAYEACVRLLTGNGE
ncbi:MAG: glycosyltransferase family 9 protein [Candidatus Hydrogenedentes bacterium]|nr:glycosyltransferase family 9 protein [Candidatus Hydrogenedentota bacterium]